MGKEKIKSIGILLRVTPEQLDVIHERMKEAHTDNREGFIRKMARLANTSGHVYETDLFDMAQKLNRIWDVQNQMIMRLSSLK